MGKQWGTSVPGVVLAVVLFLVAAPLIAAPMPYALTNNFGQDSATELLVQWHNDAAVPSQLIQITRDDDPEFTRAREISVAGEAFSLSGQKGEFSPRNIFRATVQGLQKNTAYLYRVGEAGAWSPVFRHRTSGDTREFSFTVVADPQSGNHVDMSRTLRAAAAFAPDNRFFLMAGDITNEISKRPEEILSYTTTANEFNLRTPICATQGNHDTYWTTGDNVYRFGESTIFNAFVTFPGNGCDPDKNNSQSYYFQYNNLLVISLNTLVTDRQHAIQARWLKDVLEQDRAQRQSQYVLVLCHIGPFGNRYFEKWKEPLIRLSYGQIFSDYAVDLVFYGHDHTYARSNPIKIGESAGMDDIDFNPAPDGTIYSIVGATGPKFYDASDEEPARYFPVRTLSLKEMQPGVFVNVRVTAQKLLVQACRLAGTDPQAEPPIILDTYEVPAKNKNRP